MASLGNGSDPRVTDTWMQHLSPAHALLLITIPLFHLLRLYIRIAPASAFSAYRTGVMITECESYAFPNLALVSMLD